jgi:hypothetical protein
MNPLYGLLLMLLFPLLLVLYVGLKVYKRRNMIKAIIVYADRRVKSYWVKPDNNTLTIGERSYTITKDDIFLSKNVPCYLYQADVPEPINPLNFNKSLWTAQEFNTAIESKVAREIFNAVDKKLDAGTIAMIMGAATVLAVVVVAYLGSTSIQLILEQLKEIREVLRIIGGA